MSMRGIRSPSARKEATMPTPRMNKSKCRYCERCVVSVKGGVKYGFMCFLDEWDETTVCRKGYCQHYRRKEEMNGVEK